MKKVLAVSAFALSFAAGAVVSAQVRDWHDLDDIHKHVIEAIAFHCKALKISAHAERA